MFAVVLIVLYSLIYLRTKSALDKKKGSGSLSTPLAAVTPEPHSLTEQQQQKVSGGSSSSSTSSRTTSGSGHKQLMIGGHPHIVTGGGGGGANKVQKRY